MHRLGWPKSLRFLASNGRPVHDTVHAFTLTDPPMITLRYFHVVKCRSGGHAPGVLARQVS